MRKLHQAMYFIRSYCLFLVGILGMLPALIAQSAPSTNPSVDTSLAEQYIRLADSVSKDSVTLLYQQALAIYDKVKTQSSENAIWNRYFEVGHLWCISIKETKEAVEQFELFRQAAIQKFGKTSHAVAKNHYHLGIKLIRSRQYDLAKVNYKIAIATFEDLLDTAEIIQSNFMAGKLTNYLSEYEAAQNYFQIALNQSEVFYGHNHKETAEMYYRKGQVLYNKGHYQQSLAVFDTLLKIEADIYPSNSPNLTPTFTQVGNAHFKAANYDEAIRYYEKSKAIHAKDSVKNLLNLASAIGNIGAALIEKGDFEQANALYIQAADLKKAKYGSNSVTLAYTYYNIGGGFASQGDYQSALDYFFKSVRIIREERGEWDSDVAFVYNGIGRIYSLSGEWDLALEYYQKALAIREKKNATAHPETAKVYDQLGDLHLRNKDFVAAKSAYEKALDIRQQTLNPQHLTIGDSYHSLATIYQQNKAFAKAESLLAKSLAIKEKQLYSFHPSIASTYLQLAQVAKKQTDLPRALDYYQTALVRLVPEFEATDIAKNPMVTTSFPYKINLINILYQKGLTLKQTYLDQPSNTSLLSNAFQTLTIGSELADIIRLELPSDFSKKALLKKAFVIYKELVEVGALLHQQANEAVTEPVLFALMEKSKSMLLLESIQAESAKTFAGVSAEAIEREGQLKKQVAFFEDKLVRRKEEGAEPTDKKMLELEEKLFQLRQSYQNLVTQIEQDYPQYYQLKYDNQLAGITDIQTTLPNPATALLQYTLTDDHLYVMAISQNGVLNHQQEIDTSFTKQLAAVKQFLNQAPNQQSKIEQTAGRQQYIQNAYALQQQLLAPILAKLKDITELIIIPDGDLNYLPFEALLTTLPSNNTPFDQLDYVLNQYAIHYEYSATLWWQNATQNNSTSQLFAGFAPIYQGTNLLASRGESAAPTALGLLNRSATFTPLKYNQTEVNQLASELNGQTLLGTEATESAFKEQAGQYGILHLAMHAYVNDKNPNYSHLVFAEEKDTLEDRFLYAYELYNMQLKADLAVLSACETGSGQLQQGEGVMSLSRAFKYAGVPNIVMSFWKADDFYTKNIMTQFYQFLKLGDGKHQALRQAKLAQIAAAKDNKDAAHPFYWANFVLVGNANTVQFGTPQWMGWLACGLLLLGIFGWIKK